MPDKQAIIKEMADEMMALLGSGQQIGPFSTRSVGIDLDLAYQVASRICELRRARGERSIGRKIGFTNRSVWTGYGISGPIWGYLYDTTVHDVERLQYRFVLPLMPEPRIEPEIVFHLYRAPCPGMTDDDLLGCIDWVAHGFEVVYSVFPGWVFTAADAVVACGVHGALLLGEKRPINGDHAQWLAALGSFEIDLIGNASASRSGHATNVLGGPLRALRFLVDELAARPGVEQLRPGELITTGTLTEAMSICSGETWRTELKGISLPDLRLTLD